MSTTTAAPRREDGTGGPAGGGPAGSGGPAARLPALGMSLLAVRRGADVERGILARMGDADITRCRLGTRRWVAVSKAEYVDHVLHTARLKYVKSAEFEPIKAVAGVNLLTDEGDSWARHRGVLNPMFARRRLNDLVELMCEPVHDMAGAYPAVGDDRLVLDLHEEMVRMTLRVVANALFSQDFGPIVDSMHALATKGLRVADTLNRFTLVGLLGARQWDVIERIGRTSLPVPPPFGVLKEITRGLDGAVDDIVGHRVANPTERPDLLNALLGAEDGSWPHRRVRDEAMTFMLAGHETTANALSWFWYLLALNPGARDRMYAEVDTVLQGRAPTADDLAALPWTQACVQESQRYFSAVPTLPRTAIEHDVIDGHHIRPGTTVVIPINALHHDPRYWDRPEEFDPSRFMPGAPKIQRSAYLPFGGGRRVCIGQSFALMEMVLIAAVLAQKVTFDLVPGHPVSAEANLTLRPQHGLKVVVRPRGGSGA